MTTVLLRIWRPLHELPWRIAEWTARYAITSLWVGLVLWHATAGFRGLIIALAGSLMILSLGPDASAKASSLINTVKFVYRRTLIRATWNSTMQRAKLFETVHIEESLHSLRSIPGGRKVPKLKRWGRNMIRRTPCGMALTVDGSNIGAGPTAFDGDQAAVLKAKWRCLDLIVSQHPRRPYLTLLRPIWVDPFAEKILPSQLPAPPNPPRGICVIGKDSDGNPVSKDAKRPALIAGAPGAGKSSECWMFLWSLLHQRLPFRTRVYDPKGGQEFFDLETTAYRYEANPTAWCAFLEEAIAALAARQAALKALGLRKWDPVKLAKLGKIDEFPLDVMLIDELVTVIAMMAGRDNVVLINGQKVPALKAFLVYLSQIRAAGFTVLACTQLTQKEAIGLIRDLFAYVTCLRVGSDEMVKVVLGDAKLYPAHMIPVGDDFAGIGYMSTDKGPIKYRSGYLEDEERAQAAIEIGKLSAKQWADVKHDKHLKGMPITLDVGDNDLNVTEEEAAAMDELVHVCARCHAEISANSDNDIQQEINRLVEERVKEMNGAAA